MDQATEGLGVAVPDPDALLFDDPQLTSHPLDGRESNARPYERIDCLEGLFRRPEHPDSWIRTRRISSNVREVEVESDQDSVFGETGLKHPLILRTCQPFIRNGVSIMAVLTKRFANEFRQVLVALELHSRIKPG